jgi:hypothetical protein
MTRTRDAAHLHPTLRDPPLEEPVPPDPDAVVEVSLEGACTDCGDRISAARLKALPGANRCVSCQREFESYSA